MRPEYIIALNWPPNQVRVYYPLLQVNSSQPFLTAMKPVPMRLRNHSQYLADIKRKIELNYRYPLSIAQLAREAGVSESKLQHEFPLAFATSIQDYQMKVRMEAAKALLESCDHSQKYIASAIGYKSSRSFIRAFKQATGSTPEQYRNNL